MKFFVETVMELPCLMSEAQKKTRKYIGETVGEAVGGETGAKVGGFLASVVNGLESSVYR